MTYTISFKFIKKIQKKINFIPVLDIPSGEETRYVPITYHFISNNPKRCLHSPSNILARYSAFHFVGHNVCLPAHFFFYKISDSEANDAIEFYPHSFLYCKFQFTIRCCVFIRNDITFLLFITSILQNFNHFNCHYYKINAVLLM